MTGDVIVSWVFNSIVVVAKVEKSLKALKQLSQTDNVSQERFSFEKPRTDYRKKAHNANSIAPTQTPAALQQVSKTGF